MERKTRILVLDDDSVLREQYSLLLATEGYEVFTAATASDGLGIFAQKHPQLVLLDVNLPDMDGKEVCQFIKADTSRPDTSVVLISGEVTGGPEKASGLDKGADDFLLKPVSTEELLAKVRGILRLRQTTDALRASEQYYRRLVEILPDAVLLVNLQGRLLSANPQAIAMLGYSEQRDLIERSIYDLVEKDQRQRFSALFGETLAAQVSRNHEFTLLRKKGESFPVEISTASLDTVQGHALTLVLVVRDISFRKEAEAALAKDRSLRKAILDNIQDPAWLKDVEGRFLACNEAMASLYGKRIQDLVGLTLQDLALPALQGRERAKEDLAVIRSKKPGRFESEQTNVRGEKNWFESVISPLFSQEGECVGTVGIARDITQRRRLEDELRQLSRRIIKAQEAERLRVARELHDSVNQLLASVQMRIRRIEQSLAKERPSTREILARCHQQIIVALEENRRIAHGLHPSDLDGLGLAVSCRNFCREFRARTNLKLHFVVKGFTERLPRETELNIFRIVQEALANIEKHARAKEICLSLSRRTGTVVLTIQDDGRGFDLKAGLAPRRGQFGLGLTNMKERAGSLGGSCEIQSAPGKGTIVKVEVPLESKTTTSVT
jgi:PAS domain S-box-containing protein